METRQAQKWRMATMIWRCGNDERNEKPNAAAVHTSGIGMPFTIISRTLVSVSKRKSTPEMKTTPSAVCQGTRADDDRVVNSIHDMPAPARWIVAHTPIISVASAADMHVANRTLPRACRLPQGCAG